MWNRRKRRNFRPICDRRQPLPRSWILMAGGYLIGCVIGVFVAIKADAVWLTNLLGESVDSSGRDLAETLCAFGSYGFGMLLLATSYLGFLMIPWVIALKGFFTASVFTAWIRSGTAHALLRASVSLLLPGAFLLPALLILGQLCMFRSARLFRCRNGEALPPQSGVSRAIASSLILLILASAVKTYLVPYLLSVL